MAELLEIGNTDHTLFFRHLVEKFFGFRINPMLEKQFVRRLEHHEDGFEQLLTILTTSTAGSAFSRIFFVPMELLFSHALVEKNFWDGIHSKKILGETSGGIGMVDRVKKDLSTILNPYDLSKSRKGAIFSCPFVRVSRLAAEQKTVELETIFQQVKSIPAEGHLAEFMKMLLLWWMCKKYQDEMLGDLACYR